MHQPPNILLALRLYILITITECLNTKPHIVFILADDLGYADIGYHGGAGQINTPVLDKLAYDGVRLESYYAQPVCSASRSALMSGRLPIHTGLQHFVILPAQPLGLPLNLPTLPDKLKEAGYSTHMVGKWHLGMHKEEYLPVSRGFDTFYGYYHADEDYYLHSTCSDNGCCGLDLHNGTLPDYGKSGQYNAHVFTDEAIRLIEKQSKESTPMFLYLAYQNPHRPQEVPLEYESGYEFINNTQRRSLAGQVAVLDEAVANVTAALKSTGMWDNTVLVFSSDNGGEIIQRNGVGCNYPLKGGKLTLWEGGVRVNAFVSGPIVRNPGSAYTALMHISDWYPTFLGLADVPTSGLNLDGVDQWAAINGLGEGPRQELLHNIDPISDHFGQVKRGSPFDNRLDAAIRVGDYKLITGRPIIDGWYKPLTEPDELERMTRQEKVRQALLSLGFAGEDSQQNIFLYNIAADPYERNDISKDNEDIVDMMLERLAYHNKNMIEPNFPSFQYAEACPANDNSSWEPWL